MEIRRVYGEIMNDAEFLEFKDTVDYLNIELETNHKVRTVFFNCPQHIKDEANQWGWSDTVVRDELYKFMETL